MALAFPTSTQAMVIVALEGRTLGMNTPPITSSTSLTNHLYSYMCTALEARVGHDDTFL